MISYINKMKYLKSEFQIFISETRRFYRMFQEKINALNIPADEKKKIKWDYIKELIKHRYTFNEYYCQYGFPKLNSRERDEFISVSEMQRIYRKYGFPEIREIFRDKAKFLKTFCQFIKRRWLLWDGSSRNELESMLNNCDCILKPLTGTLGAGVKKITQGSVVNIDEFIKENLSNDKYVIEECISACPEIQEFHPSSLNTVRIVTFSKDSKSVVFGAFLRMGNNNLCIDNVHGGGVFAQIDVDTGVVISDGIDTENNRYEYHPFSKKKIKGFVIPYWENVKKMCLDASLALPKIRFAGWDVAIRENGLLEFVEGNHAPDFDPMQSPLKTGVRKRVQSLLKELKIIK